MFLVCNKETGSELGYFESVDDAKLFQRKTKAKTTIKEYTPSFIQKIINKINQLIF